jgi:VanZ family protein
MLMNELRLRRLWLAIGFLLVLIVIYLSVTPQLPDVVDVSGGDKLGHFTAYAVMTLWFYQIFGTRRIRWMIGMGFIALGIALEYVQLLTGYRMFEYADMGANAAGTVCAFLAADTPLSKTLAAIERLLFRTPGH